MIQNNRASNVRSLNRMPGKAIILNRQRWNGIVQNLHRGEDDRKQSENEQQYKEYLRRESHAMTKKWENSLEKIRDKKNRERALKELEKIQEGENRYKKLKENDENQRKEKVSQANDILQKLKGGPRNLESAYIMSEVAEARKQQCAAKAQTNKAKKEEDLKLSQDHIKQADQWADEQRQKMIMNKQRNDTFKKDLLKFVKDKELATAEEAKNIVDQERRQRENIDLELKMQTEKERAYLQRKKEAYRQNALEAMQMAEQRRIRYKMENDIEDKIVSIFSNANNVEANKKENAAQIADEKERLRQLIGRTILAQIEQQKKAEHESMMRAISTDELKFSKKEQERIDQVKRIKALRIQQHLTEIQNKEQKLHQEKEMHRWDIANRLKNEEINIEYERNRREHAIKVAKENRIAILKQIERDNDRPDWRYDMNAEYLEDDKIFFEYANKLIEEARKKGRSVLPLIKAVDAYRKENNLYEQKDDLPHLQTNIKIGLKDTVEEEKLNSSRIKYDINQLKKMNINHCGGNYKKKTNQKAKKSFSKN